MAHTPVLWFEIYVQHMARAQRSSEDVLQCQLQPLTPPASVA
ncbi:MAG: VOC family protein, partial [Proteobacteria bacterium]|nr:VOC family protein [Pseudomonadota bacterium]